MEPSGAVNISDNFVAVAHVPTPVYFVAAYSGYGGMQIANNSIVDNNRKHALVLTGTSKTGAGARVENLRMHGNGVPWNLQPGTQISNLEITDLAGATTDFHTATIEGIHRANYAANLSRFNRITTGRTAISAPETRNTVRTTSMKSLEGQTPTPGDSRLISPTTQNSPANTCTSPASSKRATRTPDQPSTPASSVRVPATPRPQTGKSCRMSTSYRRAGRSSSASEKPHPARRAGSLSPGLFSPRLVRALMRCS